MRRFGLVLSFFICTSSIAFSQVVLNSIGTPETEDFNTLANSGTSSTLPTGWALSETSDFAVAADINYTADNGSLTDGDTYSYGTGTASDRAFGVLRNIAFGFDPLSSVVGAEFNNNTGQLIASLDISYTGELWISGTAINDQLDFEISTDASSLSTGTWTAVNALDFLTPDNSGSAGSRDGNNVSYRTNVSATISGLSIPDGDTFWIRWTDADAGGNGNDHGLAVDDFSLTPQTTFAGTIPDVYFTTSGITRIEGQTTGFFVGITDANSTNATTVDIVLRSDLSSGDPSDINTYTTTVTFPAGSSANQLVLVTTNQNVLIDGTRNHIFELQNAKVGGQNATINDTGNGFSQYDLTLTDDESPPFSYRSANSGDWSTSSIWEASADGGSNWGPAPFAPDKDNAIDISIRSSDVVTITTTISVDELVLNDGGTLNVNTGGILELEDGTGDDITFDPGTPVMNVTGRLRVNSGATMSGATTGRLKITGGVYEHNRDGGQIYNADWQSGSLLEVTGMDSSSPTGMNQNFNDVVYNSTGQSVNLNLGLSGSSTYGSLTLTSTNNNRLYFSESADYTLIISNDLTVSTDARFALNNNAVNGTVTVNGNSAFGAAGTSFFGFGSGNAIFNQVGNFTLSSGAFDLQASSGTTTVNLGGDFVQSGGSLSETGGGSAIINFNDNGTQTWTSSSVPSGSISFDILNGSTVDITDGSFFAGSGNFALRAGAGLLIRETTDGGIEVQATGGGVVRVPDANRIFENGSTITYQGGTAQSLGDGFGQASDVDLIINNAAGVSLSGVATISTVGLLTLEAGTLSIGSNTLTINGSVVTNTGDLGGGDNANLTIGGSGAFGVIPFATGTTSLNNFTLSRNPGSVTFGSDLEIKGAFTHTAGDLNFNGQELILSGSYSQTSGGFLVNTSSKLRIQGSGSISNINASGTIGVFELANAAGAAITSINIADSLILVTGAATGAYTMQDGSVIARTGSGTISGSITPAASAQFSVLYFGSDPITSGIELPSNTTDLFSLTNDCAALVTIASTTTVNGDLNLESGTLSVANQNLRLAGDFNVNAGINFGTTGTLTLFGTTNIDITAVPQFVNLDVTSSGVTTFSTGTLNISGDLTNNGTISSGTSSVIFNGTSVILGSQPLTFNNVVITGSVVPSSQTLNVLGNWDSSLGVFNASAGTVSFNGSNQSIGASGSMFYNLSIAGTLTKTLESDVSLLEDMSISSALDVSANDYAINIGGNWANTGTFTRRNGTVSFDGTGPQALTGTTDFTNLDIANFSNTVFNNGTINLYGTLSQTNDGRFDTDGSGSNILTLKSTSVESDAQIGVLSTPANFSGRIYVERFFSALAIPPGTDALGRNYIYISPSVTNANLKQIQDSGIPVTGNFSDASPDAANPSVLVYDAAQGIYLYVDDTGLLADTDLSSGVGYVAYTYGVATDFFTLNGEMNKGDIGIALNANVDTYSLIGNPFPSRIDWDNVSLGSDYSGSGTLNDAIYFTDNTRTDGGGSPLVVTYASGVATNPPTGGYDGEIAMGQSFWVKYTGPNGVPNSGTLTLRESHKTSDPSYFIRSAPPSDFLRMRIEGMGTSDEAIVRFHEDGSNGFDIGLDADKFYAPLVNLGTYASEVEKEMAINALPQLDCQVEVPLRLYVTDFGDYTFKFSEFESFTYNTEVTLIDSYKGESMVMTPDSEYVFEIIDDADSYSSDRFAVVVSKITVDRSIMATAAAVCQTEAAFIDLAVSEAGVIYWALAGEDTVSQIMVGTGEPMSLALDSVFAPGAYEVEIRATTGVCGSFSLTEKPTVTVTSYEEIASTTPASVCAGETAELVATGATTGSLYRWYTDPEGAPIAENETGILSIENADASTIYMVSITSLGGCEGPKESVELTVSSIEQPVIVQEELVLSIAAGTDDIIQWYYEDEEIAGANTATLVIEQAGVYTVTVENGPCMVEAEPFEVDPASLVTGLEDLQAAGIHIYPNPAHVRVKIEFAGDMEYVRVFDEMGRLWQNYTIKPGQHEMELSVLDADKGLYTIQLVNKNTILYQKLIVE